MEIGQVEFIIAWVSIIGTTLGGVFAAFMFLHREMRQGFDRHDEKIEGLRADVTNLHGSVARIEGHLGIGVPATGDQRAGDEPPGRAA